MKMLSLALFLLSVSAFAEETCKTSHYDFRITGKYIEAEGSDQVRHSYSEVRSISRRSTNNFYGILNALKDPSETDVVITSAEAKQIERFSLTVADDHEELLRLMYVKAYNKDGFLMVRYMVTSDRAYRCQ